MAKPWVHRFDIALRHKPAEGDIDIFFGYVVVDIDGAGESSVGILTSKFSRVDNLQAAPGSYRILEDRVKKSMQKQLKWQQWPAVQAELRNVMGQLHE